MDKEKLSAEELVILVKEWGVKHGITNPFTQYAKVIEETGEIAHELTRGNYKTLAMYDAIGDTLVTLIIFADILEIDPLEALREAYEEIKGRTGHTVNGGFVKEEQ